MTDSCLIGFVIQRIIVFNMVRNSKIATEILATTGASSLVIEHQASVTRDKFP